MANPADLQQERIRQKIKELEREFGKEIHTLLEDLNQTRLKGKAQLNAAPYRDDHSLRWLMKWKEAKITYEVSVVIRVEDNGQEANVGGVWVRRHASTPFDFDGHTPTTRMRGIARLNMNDLRAALEAEWG